MTTPPKRLRRLPPWGRRQRPGEAGSAAAAWLPHRHADMVLLLTLEH